MPTYDFTSPDGKTYSVTGPGSKDEAFQELQRQIASGTATPSAPDVAPVVAPSQPAKVYTEADISPMARQSRAELGAVGEGLNTLREQMQDALLLGGSDELGSAIVGTGQAAMDWFKGGSFDPVKRYSENIKRAEGYKTAREQRAPVTAAVGNVLGSLAGAGTLAKAGLTTAGRTVPYVPSILQPAAQVGTAAVEGGVVGGVQGALSAPPGERIAGGKQGAVTGGITSGLFQAAGTTASALDDIFSKRAPRPTAPSAAEKGTAGRALYKQAEDEGVRYSPAAVEKLRINTRAAAERLDPHGRPTTAAIANDILQRPAGSMSFEEFHNLQKRMSRALRDPKVSSEDKHFLQQMMDATDSFGRGVKAGDFTGGDATKAYAYKRAADETWKQHKKAELIEQTIELAESKGKGLFTQSGFTNAIKTEFRPLYRRIVKGQERGWTKDEIAQIKQLAEGGSSSRLVNTLAKFAPRGPVSIGLNVVIGSMMPLPPLVGNVITPIATEAFGRMADDAAREAAEVLRSTAASGGRATSAPIRPPTVPTIIPTAPVAMEAERQRRGTGLGGPR